MRKSFRMVCMLLLCICLLVPTALAGNSKVITLGADLSAAQQAKMLQIFNEDRESVKAKNIPLLTVTNAEERHYLKGLVPDHVIGNRAISSASVEYLGAGKGIEVETYNVNWVTADMLKNALLTAGVKDARVVVAAPFTVSGTAALTGILKAFEEIQNIDLSEAAKQAANEELVLTGELGDALDDKAKATELMATVKEKVVEAGATDPDVIRGIVVDVAKQLNIKLTPEQIEEIVRLLQQVGTLDLKLEDLKTQLGMINEKLDQVLADNGEEVKSILDKIMAMLDQIWTKLKALVSDKA